MSMFLELGQSIFLCVLLAGTVLPAVAYLAERFLFKKASASVKHRLWTLTASGLLLFPILVLIMRGENQKPAIETKTVDATIIETPMIFSEKTEINVPSAQENIPISEEPVALEKSTGEVVVISPHIETETTSKESLPVRALNLSGILWFFGFVFAVAYFSIVHLRSSLFLLRIRKDRRNRFSDHPAAKNVRLIFFEQISIPFAFGIFRPCIVFPNEANDWSKEKFDSVLLHELAHIVRRDLLWRNLVCATCAIYWFHPFLRFLDRRIRTEQELACDDMVLRSGKRSSDYATVLLELSRNIINREKIPKGGLAMFRKKTVVQRIDSILDEKTDREPIGPKTTFGIMLGVLLLSFGVSIFAPNIPIPLFAQDSPNETPDEHVSDTATAEETSREGLDLARALPESTDRERVSKYEALEYLIPFGKEPKTAGGLAKTRTILEEMVRIARKIDLPALRSEKILLIVQKWNDEERPDEAEKLFEHLLPFHREQAEAFQSALEDLKNGKNDAAKKRITAFELRILAKPNNYEKGVASIFHFSSLGKLGFIDETIDWVKKVKFVMSLTESSTAPNLSEEENYWLGYILDHSFRNAVSDVGFYWTRKNEWEKAFDYSCRMYEIGKPYSCVTNSCDSIMGYVVDHYADENDLDQAMKVAKRIRETTGTSAQWETYGIFRNFLGKKQFEKALDIARSDDSSNSYVQKTMYIALMEHLLINDDKSACAELLDEALEKSGNLKSPIDRFSDFHRYVQIAVKIDDPKKLEAIEEESRKRFDAAMKDDMKWPGGDIATERSKVHTLCELAAVRFYFGKPEEAKESFRQAIQQADKVAEMEPQKESLYQRDAALSGVARSQAALSLNEDAYRTVELISGKEWKTEGWWYLCSYYIGKKDLQRAVETLEKAKESLKEINDSRIFGNVVYMEGRLKELQNEK